MNTIKISDVKNTPLECYAKSNGESFGGGSLGRHVIIKDKNGDWFSYYFQKGIVYILYKSDYPHFISFVRDGIWVKVDSFKYLPNTKKKIG